MDTTKVTSAKRKHNSASHKLPESFGRMLLPGPKNKTWKSLTDESLLQAVAAWNWMHAFYLSYRVRGVGLAASKMSKLMDTLTIVRLTTIGPVHPHLRHRVYASMGHHTFAAIGLGLRQSEFEGTSYFTFHADTDFEFLYVTNPTVWEAIPYVANRLPNCGIVMSQSGKALPLIRHNLRKQQHSMTQVEIAELVQFLGIEVVQTAKKSKKSPCSDMFLGLAKHFCSADPGFWCDLAKTMMVQAEVTLYENAFNGVVEDIDQLLLQDPLTEAVYDQMDGEDQGEFREIGDAKQKKRLKARLGRWQQTCEEEDQESRKRRKLMRPKSKAKAKAKPKGRPKAAPPAAADPNAAPGAAGPDAVPPQEAVAPAAAAAAAAAIPEAHPAEEHAGAHERAGNYGLASGWDNIMCEKCGQLTAQKKYHPMPGKRDKSSWIMRVYDYQEKKWPTKTPLHKVQTEVTMPDMPAAVIAFWVCQYKTCSHLGAPCADV